jgi:hypothetical protein
MGCARRYDQVVEGDILVFQLNQAPLQIEILHLTQEHLHIASAAQNPADRSSNFPGRQSGGRNLIKKRLEGVMISAVDEQDLNCLTSQQACGVQAAKAAANDYHARKLCVLQQFAPD